MGTVRTSDIARLMELFQVASCSVHMLFCTKYDISEFVTQVLGVSTPRRRSFEIG
jgi:hypothetical protein